MSEIKVNKISPRTNCGTTTLGDSGDTFTIPAGVSITNNGTASGFGATGAVSWDTTVKTSTFTATAGEGYFVNTTSGAITVNLPAGTAGAVVGIKDYANTFDSNNVTVAPNGSDKIAGVNSSDGLLSTEGIAVTFVFVDSTKGWLVTDSGLQSDLPTAEYITATGGTVLTCGNFKTHVFTGPGTFCVSSTGNPSGSNSVEYLVVAGGGSSGRYIVGGGGGGGFRTYTDLGSASPLNAPAKLPVSAQGYPITVGGGGAGIGTPGQSPAPGGNSQGNQGSTSSFSTISSAGGGSGGNDGAAGGNGGSGGGTGRNNSCAGQGNTPPVAPPQGQNGGDAPGGSNGGGGGGGAGGTGSASPNSPTPKIGGPGGSGSFVPDGFFGPTAPSYGQSPTPLAPNGRYFAGGGGGSSYDTCGYGGPMNNGGAGGGGAGTVARPGGSPISICDGVPGTVNTGGGGGGPGVSSGFSAAGGAGGSGIVVIRYKFQN